MTITYKNPVNNTVILIVSMIGKVPVTIFLCGDFWDGAILTDETESLR